MRCVAAKWPQIRTIGGLRPGDPRDHGTGRAVDVMIPNWHTPTGHALGTEIAAWAQTNATALGVTYVIWDRKIWSVAHAGKGWRDCSEGSCYAGPDPSAAHLDHVHVSVAGDQGTDSPATSASGAVLPIDKGKYRISAHYGQPGTRWATRHTGLDFAAPTGTPIRAVTAGTIISAHNTHGVYGNLTKIRATDGTETWYAHQSRITAHEGQRVAAGQNIGEVGASGNASGPHLHLEVRTNGRTTDPLVWLHNKGLQP
ncbi:M23 family metallopeptidase [Tessaracoccus rhinocerotis]|uniref:M23 family metallopeptidase n=2 Tax=Tessaracoccus rhinocerotis TaxID=1689449 RepID=A0A553K6C3_9ACTN|nr:M23 family metallopeptidase [Tessaracoccus rhinocerotis]